MLPCGEVGVGNCIVCVHSVQHKEKEEEGSPRTKWGPVGKWHDWLRGFSQKFPKQISQKMRQNKRLNFVGVTTLRLFIFGSVEKYGRAVLSFENCHRELVFGRPIVVKFLSMRKKVEIDNVDPIYVFRAFLFKRHHDSRIKGGEKYRNNSNNCSFPKTAANRRAQRRLF